MKRIVKILAAVIGAVILLLLAAPLFISAEALKAQLIAKVSEATGREVTVEGPTSLTLFPNIAVSAEQVTIGNPQGFKSPYLLRAGKLATGAELKALLSGRLNVNGITIEKADVHLEETSGGAKNWQFTTEKMKEEAAEELKTEEKKDSFIKSYALGDVVIADSAVTYRRPGAETMKIEDIDLTIKGADASKPFALDGGADYKGKRVTASVIVEELRPFLEEKASPLRADIALPGGKLTFRGEARMKEGALGAKGPLSLSIGDVKELVSLLGDAAPAGPLPDSLTLSGELSVDGASYALSNAELSAGMPGGTAKFTGDASLGEAIAAQGSLALAAADLPALYHWATGKKAPPTLPKKADINGRANVQGKKYALREASLRADNLSATGSLAADLSGQRPAVSGALKFGMLDLGALLGKGPADGGSGSAGKPGDGWSTEPINLSGLNAANADLNLTAEGVRWDKLELGATDLHVTLNGGSLRANVKKTSLYGGAARGVFSAKAGGGQAIGADVAVDGIGIEPLLTALNGSSKLRGTLDGKIAVNAAGGSQAEMVRTLGGNGSLSVSKGAIKGVNFAELWREARKGFLFQSAAKETDFSDLSGSFTIDKGVLSNKDLALKSPVLRVSGEGTANIPARTVNYRLVPSLVATTKGQGGKDRGELEGINVPLLITGPWSNPQVTPDVQSIVQETLKDPQKAKENLKNIKGVIKDYNSPKDIGKALLGGGAKETAPADGTAPAPAPGREDAIKEGIGNLLKGF